MVQGLNCNLRGSCYYVDINVGKEFIIQAYKIVLTSVHMPFLFGNGLPGLSTSNSCKEVCDFIARSGDA